MIGGRKDERERERLRSPAEDRRHENLQIQQMRARIYDGRETSSPEIPRVYAKARRKLAAPGDYDLADGA